MATIENRATLKTFYQTGDIPTETQFSTLIDSCSHVNDEIREIPITGATTFTVPQGYALLWIGIHCTAGQTIKIGTTGVGSDDLLPQRTVTNGQEIALSVNVWARAAGKIIYVTGTSLTLYVREVIAKPLALAS